MRRFVAPGRVNLIGEHTDHTDGLVLPVAIDLAVSLHVEPHDRIVLTSDSADGQVDLPPDGQPGGATNWGRFVAAVAAELSEAGRPPIGMRGELRSTLPQGAGLSSSAALEVVVAVALAALAEFEIEGVELAALCRRAEHRAVGVPSGIMDQAASVLGRAGHAVLLDCATLEHRSVPLPADQALVVIDSGVRRQLESVGYGTRVEELRRALPALDGRRPADVSPGEVDKLLPRLEGVARRRLRHVVTENDRVRETAAALASADLARVGRLFADSHASLRDDFEVSTPELDDLVEVALASGATAARMTGGGFGGSIVVLAPTDHADEVAAQVLDGYRERHPRRRGAAHVCRAADGAHELD